MTPHRGARNKAERERRIQEYRHAADARKRARIARFDAAKRAAEATSEFVRESGCFPLTGLGDVNTYALFAELARRAIHPRGRVGVIVQSGIATDDTYKRFFADLNDKQALVSLFDFENRERLFRRIAEWFCLLTTGSSHRGRRWRSSPRCRARDPSVFRALRRGTGPPQPEHAHLPDLPHPRRRGLTRDLPPCRCW